MKKPILISVVFLKTSEGKRYKFGAGESKMNEEKPVEEIPVFVLLDVTRQFAHEDENLRDDQKSPH